MKKKHYRDLSIDEPLPHDMAIEAEAELRGVSDEQLKAMIEEAWFVNPGGHFRRRILRKFENAGLLRIVAMPEGHEQIQIAASDDSGVLHLIDLLTAVDGLLDEPYDPERTRTDYDPELGK